MKKILCIILIFVFSLTVFLTAALCGDTTGSGKTEHDKYLENGRFKVDMPGCDKSDKSCNDTSAYRKFQKQQKLRDESKVKNCPSCAPVKNSLSK
ncbi:MAG: hypothetical protein CVU55_13190 [Deltaproteobacteria bacterium HGW-Deltaproteobacteria-13]|jgi:hypothetical protein|nr:MAG: hypothetical protein CVU55_13190 [Deltaproteobacteria bacterium HGW-Deltaproteobacteria-13]